MKTLRKRPWRNRTGSKVSGDSGERRQIAAALKKAGITLFTLAFLGLSALAQSQSAAPQATVTPPQQPPSQTEQAKPQPKRIPAPSVADVARSDKAKVDASAPQKVYTDDDVNALPPGGISIAAPPPSQTTAKPQAKPVDDSAQKAAYWKARFTAARQKLATDKKALPALQNQLEVERVQEYVGDPDTGQLYSDTHTDVVRQIEMMKVAVQDDRKALKYLDDEFHRAGGLPGWIC
jgi:hypothetical protein